MENPYLPDDYRKRLEARAEYCPHCHQMHSPVLSTCPHNPKAMGRIILNVGAATGSSLAFFPSISGKTGMEAIYEGVRNVLSGRGTDENDA